MAIKDLQSRWLKRSKKEEKEEEEEEAPPSEEESMMMMTTTATKGKTHLKNLTIWLVVLGVIIAALIVSLSLVFAPSAAVRTIPLSVALEGYGTFNGELVTRDLSNKTSLPTPVHAWKGIDYAQQPTGDLRFQIVGPPPPVSGQQDATDYGNVCVQATLKQGTQTLPQDEACLNLNIFRPTGAYRPLPVLVWIHGGAFQSGWGGAFDGAKFVASSKAPLVVVTFNYRLNSLGFLPSQLFEDQGLLNLGFHDQHELLKFVQKHIHQFGGDPTRVTLGGQSAGAHSVGFHYQYLANDTDGLFSQAIMQSGSPTSRAFPNSSYPLYQRQYASFLSGVGCSNVTTADEEVLGCLRSADIDVIRNVSWDLYSASMYNITWPFQPARNGFMLSNPGSENWANHTFHHVPLLTSSTTDEGRLFTPHNLNTSAEFISFMSNIAPNMNATSLYNMSTLYPDPLDPSINANTLYTNSPLSPQYTRISAAYSDYAYICMVQESAHRVSAAGLPVYKSHWNTNNSAPSWQGVPHSSDFPYTFDSTQVQFPEVAEWQHAYFASYVATGDPSVFRAQGSPEWPTYDLKKLRQLRFDDGEAVVEEDVDREEACAFWRAIPDQLDH